MVDSQYPNEYPYAAPDQPPGPTPGPSAGPLPLPNPPFPFPPPDWWRCFRRGPVSGRYEGAMTAPNPGRMVLELRVDIDPRYANSPVMDRISGDLFQVHRIQLPGRPAITWRVYLESWIVDQPTVNWSRCFVDVSGTVRFWKGTHPATSIRVHIPWGTFTPAGPATVTMIEPGGITTTYVCGRKSDCFRVLNLEVDVAQSVNAPPILPDYDTHAHPTRPPGLPQRVLTVAEAYREAGVCVTMRPGDVVDDSAPQFTDWSPAELHDAMEDHYSRFTGGWPAWEMWGFLAGTFENPNVGGIMFDAAAAFGGAGEAPERQGFAVFRNHSWFANLPAAAPANDVEADALRQYLYTWVHEAGHAFNFLHSWNKNRPDSLSWMNYDWRYDARNGTDSFWSNFTLRFDDEELIHMRHGDRASVIMGGDPWASGGHMEAPPGAEYLEAPPGAMSQIEGRAPLELYLRSEPYFAFLEPVEIEVRLRNNLTELPVDVVTQLDPSFGGLTVYIRRPDGRIVQYAPIMCQLATPEFRTLQPLTSDNKGDDRYSESIFLSYGRYGFYFDEPGEYLVRAVYQGAGDILIPSNLLRLRVGHPASREEDRLAQDYFTYPVGMSLYLGGSRSPFLQSGMATLAEVADRYGDSLVGAKAATILARSEARPFYRITGDDQHRSVTQLHQADPEAALARTEPVVALYRQEASPRLNLLYRRIVQARADLLAGLGNQEAARNEVATLRQDLQDRGVNPPVLAELAAYEQNL